MSWCLAYLKSPKSGVGVFDGRFRNDPPCHGHYTWRSWSPILDVRWWPGTLEFPEHTGVPSQDCLIGAERALPMQIWRVYMFFLGGRKNKRCPKNIISQSSHRWCSKLNHAFVTSQKNAWFWDFTPTTTIAWLKHTAVLKSGWQLNMPFWVKQVWGFPIKMMVPPNHIKSPILIGFSIIFTIHFGVPLFLETPV